MAYVPLGIHTEYSLLHGMCRVDSLVERARALRLTALGITDLHSAYGFVHFYRAAQAAGVRPILGTTLRLRLSSDLTGGLETPAQIIVLARDLRGYRNLLRLLSQTHLENGPDLVADPALANGGPATGLVNVLPSSPMAPVSAEPCATLQDLDRFHTGLLAFDGGIHGPVARALSQGLPRQAERAALSLREIFGADGFYMEVQRHGTPDESLVEPFILRLARTLNVPVVATNDVRYLEPADAEAYDVLRCIGTGHTLADPSRPRLGGSQYYLKSDLEMRQLFRDLPEALANTCVVAEQCKVELELGTANVPEFSTDSGREPMQELRRECARGACRRFDASSYQDLPVAVRDRLAHELAVTEEKKLASYFLIVQDVVRYAKEEGIPVGPGRGSAAGSLIAYALGITQVDPLAHGLLFERFLSRARPDLPDISLDVGHTRREALFQYASRRFGADRVAHLGSLATFSMRAVAREVGRVLALRPEELDEISKSLRPEGGSGLLHALDQSPRLRQAYQEDVRIRRLFDVARRLEGLPRYPVLHAGGLLIAPGPVTDFLALQRTPAGDIMVQATPEDAEALGLAKVDLAGLRFLSALHDALQLVLRRHGLRLDPAHLPLDDAATYRMLARGDTACLFQIESAGMQNLLRDLQPSRFQDLVSALSLYRPGPIGAGQVERYLARHSGLEPVTYAHPDLEPILRDTHGIILFQEQLMQAAATIGGYDLDQADALRHAVARRQIGDLARERAKFLRGAVERGIELQAAEQVFDALMRFANFGFDKAHSTAYAMLAYTSAYLRVHYAVEYAVALLNNNLGQGQRIREILADAIAHRIPILDVDVNRSGLGYVAEGDGIRIGLAQVKALREGSIERILDERSAGGGFRSLYDFCCRTHGLPRRSIECLIKAGAFGCLGLSRAQALSMLGDTLQAAQQGGGVAASASQMSLEFGEWPGDGEAVNVPDVPELLEAQLAELEREVLDVSARNDLPVQYADLWQQHELQSSDLLSELPERASVRVGGVVRKVSETFTRQNQRMAFVELEDLHGPFEAVLFPDVYARVAQELEAAGAETRLMVTVDGTVDRLREQRRVVARSVEVLRPPAAGDRRVTRLSQPITLQGGPPRPNAERRVGRLAASNDRSVGSGTADPLGDPTARPARHGRLSPKRASRSAARGSAGERASSR